ncbi:hypothetical protein AMS68_005460 [Peltaster fructicola]|uniref:Pyrroline-5-carboxylate reductase n=1 Tax=Peltaster fructicola TaxID=286661 RepID=A0A6H0XYV8_9PEZI|nr:hypothetical protein AMS68_005460 [Peltaster fructicola]
MSRDLTPEYILKEALAVQQQANRDYINSKSNFTVAFLGCELGKYDVNLNIAQNDNLAAVQEADIVLLGCKPYMVKDVLTSDIRDALKGKVLISILAGVPESQISQTLYQDSPPEDACRVVRAMPNTAAAVRESMTVIGTSQPPLASETQKLITWMFKQIGRVVYLPAANMDVCTALCGSGPAFVSLILESMAAGAVAMGLPRDEAYTMAAQTMRGASALVLGGEHPAILRDKVTTPGGCTIGGLLVLEEGGVRGTVARAVREATVVASQLGQGKQGVNVVAGKLTILILHELLDHTVMVSYDGIRSAFEPFFADSYDNARSGKAEEMRTASLLSLRTKMNPSNDPTNNATPHIDPFPHCSLLGRHVGEHPHINRYEPILLNTNVPASTFICGSQGSGKSYTLSCMLENYIKPDPKLGTTDVCMAGLLCHYDIDSSSGIAEAAALCSLGVKVQVLVPPTNEFVLRQRYEALPGAKDYLRVIPLYIQDRHLTVPRMMQLMAVSDADGPVPLYMSVVVNLLRKLAMQFPGEPVDYQRFIGELDATTGFANNQSSMLRLRLNLLESCLARKQVDKTRTRIVNIDRLVKPGTLTICDMSCPTVDQSDARVFFQLVLGIFKAARPQPGGLVVALDEAHKFMNESAGPTSFTESLTTTIREQRHVATRVLIATQEPTIATALLDLCSVSIVHRFTSPSWLRALTNHLGAAQLHGQQSGQDTSGLMEQIMELRVGESLVFAPSACVCTENGQATMLKNGIMKMKTRKRLGHDQGLSSLADV